MCWRAIEHNAALPDGAGLLHDHETLAALESARADHVAAAGRGHAVQEAMAAAARNDLRLIGALRHASSFDNNIAPAGRNAV